MSKIFANLNPELFRYALNVSLRDNDIKRRLRRETAALPEGGMQITPEQGQFMALLIALMGARQVLEIGTFTGYSTLCMAEALPEDGRIIACDCSEEWTSIGRRYWREAGVAEKIDLRLGDARTSLDHLLQNGMKEAFDLIFIDADKGGYGTYYEKSLQLLRRGGLIMVDNALWGGRVADDSVQDEDTQSIRNLNKKIRDDERVEASLILVGDGLYLARKKE